MNVMILPSICIQGKDSHKFALRILFHFITFSDDKKIHLGPNHKLVSTFDESIFYPISRLQNGSRVHGEAVKAGSSSVTASFEKLNTKAELFVYQNIELSPALVILPFDPNNPKR